MASSLFGNNRSNQQNNNGMTGMLQQFQQFKAQLGNGDPQAMVQELLRTGKMSQQQYQQLSEMARQLQGFLK